MPWDHRNRKRIFIFLLIPLLSAVQFFTEDFLLRLVAAVLLVIYVAFIIFLRDSIRQEDLPYREDEFEAEEPVHEENEADYETDYGEDFKIISSNKKIEVRSAEDVMGGIKPQGRTYFKPPDLKENFTRIATERLPDDVSHDEHFGFILSKILSVVKESYLAHSALFFWFNKRKQKLALERFASSSSDIILQKFEVEDDILSKIVQKEEPELLTDIPEKAEKDVIRYYSRPQGIRSFVGVPLYYGDQLSGVLAIDSKVVDAFGIETIYSLGRFVRVISSIISLFDEKFTSNQADQRLKSLLNILATDKKFDTEDELFSAIESSVKSLIYWDAFTFINYSAFDNKFKISKISNKTSLKYVGENLEIELNGTLAGKAVLTGLPVKLDDTSNASVPRYTKNEDVTFDGSFLAIPLSYDEQNFGVLCFESLKKSVYTNSDIEFLKKATKIFSFIVYSYSTHSVLKSNLSVDLETGLLNKKSFLAAVALELRKSVEMQVPGSVLLLQIDEFLGEVSLFEGDPLPKVIKTVTAMIKDECDEYAITGRVGDKMFAIYFFNTPVKDAFLWAEKLRIKIARKPIAVASKQTTFTVSVGVANATTKSDIEEVFYNAELALNKALEKGGNAVKSL
ncbi:MAG: diguanylate cyclase [Melioribacteraceae bacterium]|nr:diguanylate cyclase [Melioribacteraceae bacterium]